MPLSPNTNQREKANHTKPADSSLNGLSMAMALMVESMVNMVQNSQALEKNIR